MICKKCGYDVDKYTVQYARNPKRPTKLNAYMAWISYKEIYLTELKRRVEVLS